MMCRLTTTPRTDGSLTHCVGCDDAWEHDACTPYRWVYNGEVMKVYYCTACVEALDCSYGTEGATIEPWPLQEDSGEK